MVHAVRDVRLIACLCQISTALRCADR